jgi:hypothetical protein
MRQFTKPRIYVAKQPLWLADRNHLRIRSTDNVEGQPNAVADKHPLILTRAVHGKAPI